jgi:hypothetical protein
MDSEHHLKNPTKKKPIVSGGGEIIESERKNSRNK